MRSIGTFAALLIAAFAVAPASAETANTLAVQARAFHEAAALETDLDKRLSLLRDAEAALHRIATEDPGDPYAKRLATGEAILGLTIARIDHEIDAIEREKKRLTGTPGSYVALFGADGKPLYSVYWIAPNVISIADGYWTTERAPDAVPSLLIDRYLLPRALVAPYYFWTAAIDYARLADDFDVPAPGHGFSTTGTVVKPDPPSGEAARTFPVDFAWKDPVTTKMAGTRIEGAAFTATNAFHADLRTSELSQVTVSAVYFPVLSFGFEQKILDVTVNAIVGRDAMSSADFSVILKLADKRVSAGAHQCLTDLRADGEYKAYNLAWAELERRTEKVIAGGTMDVLAIDDGMKPYLALDRKYGIAKRFNECLTK